MLIAVRIKLEQIAYLQYGFLLIFIKQKSMDLFRAESGAGKLAKDLTANALLMSTSKYVKNGPVPVGQYQATKPQPANERYGSNRRLKPKTEIGSKAKDSLQSQPYEFKQSNDQKSSQSNTIYSQNLKNMKTQKNVNVMAQFLQSQNKYQPAQQKQTEVVTMQRTYTLQRQQSNTPTNSMRNRGVSQIQSLNSNVSNRSAANITPQASRYGANRRVESKKTQQRVSQFNDHEDKVKLSIDIEQPKQVQQIGTPKSQIKLATQVSQKSSQVSTPVNRINNKQYFASPHQSNINSRIQKSNSTQVYQPSQNQNKSMSRNVGGSELRSRQSVPLSMPAQSISQQFQNKSENVTQKKRSNIIVYLLKNMYNKNTSIPFYKLKQNSLAQKNRQQKFVKIFVSKLSLLANNKNIQACSYAMQNIVKVGNINRVQAPNMQNIHNIEQNTKKISIFILHRLCLKQLGLAFSKINIKKSSINRSKLANTLKSLVNQKLLVAFRNLRFGSTFLYHTKSKCLLRMVSIIKGSFVKDYQIAFKRLKFNTKSKNQEANNERIQDSPNRQTKSVVPSPQSSPQKNEKDKKIIIKLESDLQRNTKKLHQLEGEYENQKSQIQSKIQNLKISIEELVYQNEQKSKFNSQLKQRMQSLECPEEHYIQDQDILGDTKFPALYDVYIKLQKSSFEQIHIEDVVHTFPLLQDDMRKDALVRQWIELGHNLWLKNQISAYEGTLEYERKAAKVAIQQQELVKQMIRGYVKQKYTWQWVKSALSNVSLPNPFL